MNTRLSQKLSKSYYREILNKALDQAKVEYESSPNISLNESIYRQLVDIKQSVIVKTQIFTEEESRNRYSLGVLVVRNFDGYLDSDWDYPKMLIDIAAGVSRYPKMPEVIDTPINDKNK